MYLMIIQSHIIIFIHRTTLLTTGYWLPVVYAIHNDIALLSPITTRDLMSSTVGQHFCHYYVHPICLAQIHFSIVT